MSSKRWDGLKKNAGGEGEEFANVLGKVPQSPASMLFRQPQFAVHVATLETWWGACSPVSTASSKLPKKPLSSAWETFAIPKAYWLCSVTWLWSFVHLPPLPFTFQPPAIHTHPHKHAFITHYFSTIVLPQPRLSRFLIRTWQKWVSVKPRPL